MDISKISSSEIWEICREYERAEDQSKQIQISSELHLLSKDTIKAILVSQGYSLLSPKKKTPRPYGYQITITMDGKTLTAVQWAKELGISANTIRARYYKGMEPKDILSTTPIRR